MKSKLLTIFLVVFVDLLGFGLVIPILPYYATEFGASATQLGWLMAIYSLMQFLFAPFWGRLSDIVGRRPIIIMSVLGTAASMTLLGAAPSLKWLFIGRMFAGICGANISTATAYIADVTDEANRAKGMGIIGASFGLGFIFGPAIGGILSVYGYGAPAYAAAVLSLVNAVFAYFSITEPEMTREARSANRSKRFDLSAIQRAWTSPATRNVIAVFFVVTMAFTQMEACFALFMRARFGFDAKQAGWFLAYMGLIMVFLQGGAIHRLVKVFGEGKLSITGVTLMGIGLLVITQTSSLTAASIGMTFVALGNGMNQPSLMSLISRAAPIAERGAVMGVYQSAGSLARVVGPPVAGFLFDRMGINSPFLFSAAMMGGAAAMGSVWFLSAYKTNRATA